MIIADSGFKACIICKEDLPNTHKYFYRNSGCKDSLTPRCKVCIEKIRNGTYFIVEHTVPDIDGYKTCTICHKSKTINEFYVDRKNPSGYRRDCKECTRNRVTERYNNNKEIILRKVSDYQKTEMGKFVDRNRHSKRRKLGCIEYIKNPFAKTVDVDWHHFFGAYIVAIPRDLHRLYGGKPHRRMCMEIVKQIYLW